MCKLGCLRLNLLFEYWAEATSKRARSNLSCMLLERMTARFQKAFVLSQWIFYFLNIFRFEKWICHISSLGCLQYECASTRLLSPATYFIIEHVIMCMSMWTFVINGYTVVTNSFVNTRCCSCCDSSLCVGLCTLVKLRQSAVELSFKQLAPIILSWLSSHTFNWQYTKWTHCGPVPIVEELRGFQLQGPKPLDQGLCPYIALGGSALRSSS